MKLPTYEQVKEYTTGVANLLLSNQTHVNMVYHLGQNAGKAVLIRLKPSSQLVYSLLSVSDFENLEGARLAEAFRSIEPKTTFVVYATSLPARPGYAYHCASKLTRRAVGHEFRVVSWWK